MTEQRTDKDVFWVPLESNPDMLNKFAHGLGLPENYGFVDVYGIDEDLLAFVPSPRLGVTLLFDSSCEMTKEFKAAQDAKIKAEGQTVSEKVFYCDQQIGNACGTIAALHCIANNAEAAGLPADSPIGTFMASVQGKNSAEIGAALIEADAIHGAAEECSQGGQTAAPAADSKVDMHFISFVEVDGDLYELDGNKACAINHGPTDGDLLKKATQVVKQNFMDVNPDSMHFNMMALAKLS
jgi:ubiquitin carboxyl-terminal hydrolase L3